MLRKIYVVILFIALLVNANAQTDSTAIDSLQKVLATQKDDTNKVNTLNEISEKQVSNEAGMQNAVKAVSLSRTLKFKKGEGEALLLIGEYYYSNNQYPEAIKYGLQALQVHEDIKDLRGRAMAHFLLDASYGMQGNYSENLKHAFAALKLYEEIGDKAQIANMFADLANIYISHDNYVEGYKYAQLGLDAGRTSSRKSLVSYCLGLIADTDVKNGKLTEALQKYREALAILEDLGSEYLKYGAGDKYRAIGDVYKLQGEKALDSGYSAKAMKEFELAKDNYQLALKYEEEANITSFVAMEYINLGDIAIKFKKIEEARNYLEKGLKVAKSTGFKMAIRDGYYKLSGLDSMTGNHQQAYINFKNYILYRDSLKNEEFTKNTVQTQMQYEFDKTQAVAKTEQQKKDAEQKRLRNQQYFISASLGILVLAVIIIALIQFRSNKHRQKANALLQQEKEKVESTLIELKSTQAQLIQSEKMASLGELTAGIAHEIQNPLNFVNNFSEVNKELVDELEQEADKGNIEEVKSIARDIKKNEEKINHHGKRADAIVKGMMQHSRANTGQKEPTDINALCDEYLRLSYHGLRAKDKSFNADFKTDFDESIGKINIVPQDIGRVLLNLYNNAFYAVNEKLRQAQPDSNYEPKVAISTKAVKPPLGGLGVLLTVTDNGNGIPQNIVDKIFQPFFTTK
ncbi:MAG: ATP-binding protein, partial [Ginsengibacter sp.]